jgi:hypothetical protein
MRQVSGNDFIRPEFSKNHRFGDIRNYWESSINKCKRSLKLQMKSTCRHGRQLSRQRRGSCLRLRQPFFNRFQFGRQAGCICCLNLRY